jgi:glycosyltransferase involved in cell wall biosynthesis
MNNQSKLNLHLIIPAYNEEQTIELVLQGVCSLPVKFSSLIVVDNASTDLTATKAKEFGAIVVSEMARGYGAACLRGIEEVRSRVKEQVEGLDVVVFMDADYSDYPEDIIKILEPIRMGMAEFVVGSRLSLSGSKIHVPPVSRFGNAFACFFINKIYGFNFTDLGPLRAITLDALTRIKMKDRTWGWTLEMQLKAGKFSLKAQEVPVQYRFRGAGKSKISQSFIGSVRAATKILYVLARHVIFAR